MMNLISDHGCSELECSLLSTKFDIYIILDRSKCLCNLCLTMLEVMSTIYGDTWKEIKRWSSQHTAKVVFQN